ncbi:unnamed protein product [Black beetle virus]|uniref:(BBV) RNA2 sequence for coat protein n=1 Tax=Black beetle virus TaxID=12285 RepID=Q7T8V5_BBV|nr:URF [Black beetle virus]pir/QQBB2G/ hypothetical protein - black beetle virus [Black beetle virus]CAA25469.1 unnamed protein product [Black beetle virus]
MHLCGRGLNPLLNPPLLWPATFPGLSVSRPVVLVVYPHSLKVSGFRSRMPTRSGKNPNDRTFGHNKPNLVDD